MFKERHTADAMKEGGICVCRQEIGKAAPQYEVTGGAPLQLSQTWKRHLG